MPLAPSQILSRLTETGVVDLVFEVARELGFKTTSWQDGSSRKTLIRGFARNFAAGSNVLGDTLDHLLTNPGTEGEIAGLWQDVKGTYWYQLPRLEAVKAEREITFTSAASAAPHVIATGSQITADGIAFETTAADAALAPGASVTLAGRALVAGTAGNMSASSAAVRLVTPYAGVTATLTGDPTKSGTDREGNARYQTRLDLRLSELTYSVGLRAYELWALTADGSIDRVAAWSNHPNPNEIYVAIEPGTPAQIAACDAYFATRLAVNDLPSTFAATPNPQTITATPRLKAGAVTVAQIEAKITAYLDSMPLGGERVAGAPAGRLLREKIAQVVLCAYPSAMTSLGLSSPAADVIMGRDEYVVPTFNITPEWY